MELRDSLPVKIFASIISGILLSLGFPGYTFPNLAIPYVVAIAFVPLFLVIFTLKKDKYILKSIFYIWIFGLTFQLTSFFWVSQPIIYFSGLSEFVGYCLFIIISFLTSTYFIILLSPIIFYFWLKHKVAKTTLVFIYLSALIASLEIIIPRFFNWSIGQLFNENYFWQLCSIFGFNTGTFVLLITNFTIAYAIFNYRDKHILLKGILFNSILWTGVLLFGFLRINLLTPEIDNAKKVRIAFIQPNFTFQELASKRIHAKNAHEISLNTVLQMSNTVIQESVRYDQKVPDLLIWPESVAPDGIFQNPVLQNIVTQFSKQTKVPILVQDVIQKQKHPSDDFWSIWSVSKVISENGISKSQFEKWVPIPFGETLPLENTFPKLGALYRKLIKNSSRVESGNSFNALNVNNSFNVAPLICFDSIYPKLPYLQSRYGNAEIYINQANFMWMVNSNAGLEFSYLDKARAVENARSMIMVANTGPTIAFDPLGRTIWGPSDLMSSDLGFFDVPLYQGRTLFSYVYNWPILLFGLFALYKLVRLLRSKSS